MNRKICLLLTLAAMLSMLLLSACANVEPEDSGDGFRIYRLLREEYHALSEGELIRGEDFTAPESGSLDSLINSAILACLSPSGDKELKSAFPVGTQLLSFSLSNGELTVNLGDDYGNLTGIDRSVADYCLASTLCQLQEVESLTILLAGEPVRLGMTADDGVLHDSGTNPDQKEVRIYFVGPSGRYLNEERHTLVFLEDENLERHIVEELLMGRPVSDKLRTVISPDTALLGVSTDDEGVCTVNLSGGFLNELDDYVSERLAVYSIVNSLTLLSHVNSVIIQINGSSEGLSCVDISSPLERNEEMVGPVNSAKGQKDADIYLLCGDELTAIPRIVTVDAKTTIEQAALDALFSSRDEPGFLSVFANDDLRYDLIAVENMGNKCRVRFPSGFFDGVSVADERLMKDAIRSTLESVNSLTIIFEEGK